MPHPRQTAQRRYEILPGSRGVPAVQSRAGGRHLVLRLLQVQVSYQSFPGRAGTNLEPSVPPRYVDTRCSRELL